MAMTLRLDEELQSRVRAEAERQGCSQQAVIKEALRKHLRVAPTPLQRMVEQGLAIPPKRPRGRSEAAWSSPISVMEMLEYERQERL